MKKFLFILFTIIFFNSNLMSLELLLDFKLVKQYNADRRGLELIKAIKEKNDNLAQSLIQNDTNLNIKDKQGDTALVCAAIQDNKLILTLLLDKGANPNIQNQYGETALMRITDKECTKLLISKGADLDIQDKEGKTALVWTTKFYKFAGGKISILIESGADTKLKDHNNNSCFDYVSNNKSVEWLNELIRDRQKKVQKYLLDHISIAPLCDIITNYM